MQGARNARRLDQQHVPVDARTMANLREHDPERRILGPASAGQLLAPGLRRPRRGTASPRADPDLREARPGPWRDRPGRLGDRQVEREAGARIASHRRAGREQGRADRRLQGQVGGAGVLGQLVRAVRGWGAPAHDGDPRRPFRRARQVRRADRALRPPRQGLRRGRQEPRPGRPHDLWGRPHDAVSRSCSTRRGRSRRPSA